MSKPSEPMNEVEESFIVLTEGTSTVHGSVRIRLNGYGNVQVEELQEMSTEILNAVRETYDG